MTPLDWYASEPDPRFLLINADDPRPLNEQLQALGFNPQPPGGTIQLSAENHLIFPDLPPLVPTARAVRGLDQVFLYLHGFLSIVEISGQFTLYLIKE